MQPKDWIMAFHNGGWIFIPLQPTDTQPRTIFYEYAGRVVWTHDDDRYTHEMIAAVRGERQSAENAASRHLDHVAEGEDDAKP